MTGLFAVTGQDPAVLLYKQNAMRKHILNSNEGRGMSIFPSSASRHPKASIRENVPVYCICQRHINDGCKIIKYYVIFPAVVHVTCMKIDKSVHKDAGHTGNVELPFVQYCIN